MLLHIEVTTTAVARIPCLRVQRPWSWWTGRPLMISPSRHSMAVKVWLCGWKRISAFLWVEPFTDQREPGFVHRLFGAEQQPVPVRAVRLSLSRNAR